MSHSVDELILRHFGLRENPFGVTPDPRFLFLCHTHREALASLVNGIQCGFGFQVLVAQPGMGKTTLLFNFLERFNDSRTAFLFQQQHDPREFLQSLLIELKSDSTETSQAKMYGQLNHLLSDAALTGKRVIVIVDEAQNLEDSLLETLRQLSNLETARSKLMQIVLAGQPQLARKLAQPEQQQLRQRVSTVARLSPLKLDETRAYLSHRLTVAGYRGPEFFTTAALQLIWTSGHGIPRNINTLCFNAMMLAFAQNARRVDDRAVKEAAQDLDLDHVLAEVAGSAHPVIGPGCRGLIAADRREPAPIRTQQSSRSTGLLQSNLNQGGVMTSVAEPVEHSSLLSVDNQRVIVNDTKQSHQQPVVVQSHSNGGSGAPPVLPSVGSRVAPGKRALWVLLVAAAVGTGVLLGHGLRVRGLGQAEGNAATVTQPQRSQEPPVLDAPLTSSRKPISDADDGPEVIVRNFTQSPASTAATPQENVKAIFFEGDSSVVSGKYDITLQRIAELLDANPQSTAILEGHTDASGLESYNQELSMRRAIAVKDVLVEEYHIAASRLSTIGAGSATPLESNTTDSGRAYKRRVEVRIRQGSD